MNLSDMTPIAWLPERTILLAPTGSHAYGTMTADSDQDFKGVCIPPKEYYLGLESFNEYNNTGGKNFKNAKDDTDVSIIHINKFVRDAMSGVPNNIEILFVERDKFIKITRLGQRLIDNRHLFLSKNITKRFSGYAHSQMQKMKNKVSNGTGRQELVAKYGYDTKFFMHSIRLLTSAIEILETGDYQTFRPNREFLLECRNGRYTFEEALEMIESYDSQMQELSKTSTLRSKPDYQKINNLLIGINEESMKNGF